MTNLERCVCCGEIIPEGGMVCSNCQEKTGLSMRTEKKKRLIDANALMDALRTNEGAKALGHSVHRLFCIDEIIQKQPTVEAEDVVRCKNCKRCRMLHPTGEPTPFYFCPEIMIRTVKPDGFCSFGERRTK